MENNNNKEGGRLAGETWHRQKRWSEEAHREFYQQLKKLPREEQKEALLTQASVFALHGADHPSNLKAAESLISYWGRHLADAEEREELDTLFRELHRKAPDNSPSSNS